MYTRTSNNFLIGKYRYCMIKLVFVASMLNVKCILLTHPSNNSNILVLFPSFSTKAHLMSTHNMFSMKK